MFNFEKYEKNSGIWLELFNSMYQWIYDTAISHLHLSIRRKWLCEMDICNKYRQKLKWGIRQQTTPIPKICGKRTQVWNLSTKKTSERTFQMPNVIILTRSFTTRNIVMQLKSKKEDKEKKIIKGIWTQHTVKAK